MPEHEKRRRERISYLQQRKEEVVSELKKIDEELEALIDEDWEIHISAFQEKMNQVPVRRIGQNPGATPFSASFKALEKKRQKRLIDATFTIQNPKRD